MTVNAQVIRPHLRSGSQHQPQTRKRARVGLLAVAAAIAAVASLLLTDASALAEAPPPSPTSTGCADLQSITLTANTARSAGQAASQTESTPNGCGLTASIGAAPDHFYSSAGEPPEPCQATFTPSAMGSTGMRVTVVSNGNCDGVSLSWQSTPPTASGSAASAGGQAGVSGASSQFASAYGKLIGNEQFDISTFWARSNVAWGYTLTTVDSASHTLSDWARGLTGWAVASRSANIVKHGSALYQSTNGVNFKNSTAGIVGETVVRLNIKPGGSFTCGFKGRWKPDLPLWHFDSECDSN